MRECVLAPGLVPAAWLEFWFEPEGSCRVWVFGTPIILFCCGLCRGSQRMGDYFVGIEMTLKPLAEEYRIGEGAARNT